ncbi:nitroreductase family protein [Micromonospora yangpuensis]|uniref:Nitroreductase n=1 Tax=Micromonospora yangpuensis TaxID=683228 RepID=A0A1C6VFT7_9ACTN|nr:nitroreductase family protein [Micromonospora yangpuensis]GGM31264.1 nitroreductase [Micromonospora yangpuensis]SCL65203.1 Nitroreductase [Micromonospora yangpuensis]
MADLTPLLAVRWSPLAFDPTAELTAAEASALLEAARWAPSHGNVQPWRFALGRRDDETGKRILANLPARDQRWARHAAALLVAAHLADPPATAPPAATAAPGTAPVDAFEAVDTEAFEAAPVDAFRITPADAFEAGQRRAYDLGQAVAHLSVQATALGLYVHQLVDVDHAGLAADLDLPAEVRPHAVVAIGRLGDPFALPADLLHRETGLRRRHRVADLMLR